MSSDVSPTIAEIDLFALRNNAEIIKSRTNSKVLFVVKADAYGHGMVRCAQELERNGADYFGVAIASEGVRLRTAGINIPILVFGGLSDFQIDTYLDNNLTFTIPSVEKLQAVDRRAIERNMQARIHIKIDTGMGRLGTHWDRLDAFVVAAQNTSSLLVYEGIYSHFSDSEGNNDYTQIQYERFIHACTTFKKGGIFFEIKHIANSGGITNHLDMKLDMVRSGLATYGLRGVTTDPIIEGLQPVLSLKTRVVFFKVVSKGEYVGYGSSWSPSATYERIVTLPVGYADGYARALGNKASVLIHGKRYPVIGRVSMDQSTVSLGQDGEAYNGDEVVLIGKQGDQEIHVEDLAQILDTISYEIICSIGERVPRVYIG